MIPYGSLWFPMALYDSPVCLSLCLHFLKDEENGLKTTLGDDDDDNDDDDDDDKDSGDDSFVV